jgi:hypothetical protein
MWNTRIIDFLRSELHGNDSMFKETPYYRGDVNLRKANLDFHLTDKERDIMGSIGDPMMFVEYLGFNSPVLSPTLGKIKLYDYQKDFIQHTEFYKFVVVAKSRQMGMTLLGAIIALHYATTYSDKMFLYLTVNNEGAAAFIDKVKALYASMPFFMKPGIISWNAKSIEFDNGCRIVAKGATPDVPIGGQTNFIFMDEAGLIKDAHKVFRSIAPHMAKGKDCRVIVVSTPNGYNWFYDLFVKAEDEANEFKPLRYLWNLVPGRDEAWKRNEILNLGSEDKFNMEYGLQWSAKNTVGAKITEDDVDTMLELPTKEWLESEIKELKSRIKKLEDLYNGRK